MNINRLFEMKLAQRLATKLNFIQVVLGPRQVGKTTGAQRIFESWKRPKHMASADALTPPEVTWIERQ